MTADIRAINCTSCGAGQDVLGGGRVETYVCPYCGSALDAQDDFKILREHLTMARLQSDLSIGDQGRINGVAFSVIGTVGWSESYGHQRWGWVDHQIYSPTHGYGWITREDNGNYTYTRKLRQQPQQWLTPTGVELADQRPAVWLNNKRYRYYDTSTAEITFLEGAFNWAPELGPSGTVISAIGDGEMVSLSQTAQEREVELTRLLTTDELRSFNLSPKLADPATPLAVGPVWPHMRFSLLLFALAAACALVLGLAFGGASGRPVAQLGQATLADLPIELPVVIPDDARLLRVYIQSNLNNAWLYVDMELEPEGEGGVAQETGAEISYYTGRDSDGHWTEGARQASQTFAVLQPGPHVLTISAPEVGGTLQGAALSQQGFSANLRTVRSSSQPMFLAAVIFAVLFAGIVAAEFLRRARQHRGSDWTTDD